jgi:hypothetical protein
MFRLEEKGERERERERESARTWQNVEDSPELIGPGGLLGVLQMDHSMSRGNIWESAGGRSASRREEQRMADGHVHCEVEERERDNLHTSAAQHKVHIISSLSPSASLPSTTAASRPLTRMIALNTSPTSSLGPRPKIFELSRISAT